MTFHDHVIRSARLGAVLLVGGVVLAATGCASAQQVTAADALGGANTTTSQLVSSTKAISDRTMFVSPTGSDTAAGTSGAPFRTVQKGVGALGTTGGTVELAGGTYTGQRVVISGASGVVLRAAPGATPVLDGTGLTIGDGWSAAVEVRNSTNVTVQGLTITGYRTKTAGRTPVGILVTGSGSDITVTGNHVHHMGHDGTTKGSADINAHGIAVYGTSATKPISRLTISDNEVDHLKLGASESVVVNGNVDGWAVDHNRVHDNDNIGIDAIGFETTITGSARYTDVNRARNGRITNNTVSGISADTNPAYQGEGAPCHCADGVYVDGGKDIVISGNSVTTSDIGIEVAAEDPKGRTDGIKVRGNTVTKSAWVGLSIGGYAAGRGEAAGVTVTRNTLTANNTLDDGSPEILLQYKVHHSSITDNTVTAAGSDPSIIERVAKAGTAAQNAGVTIDRNTYASPARVSDVRFTWFGKEASGFTAWKKASGQDATSTYRQC